MLKHARRTSNSSTAMIRQKRTRRPRSIRRGVQRPPCPRRSDHRSSQYRTALRGNTRRYPTEEHRCLSVHLDARRGSLSGQITRRRPSLQWATTSPRRARSQFGRRSARSYSPVPCTNLVQRFHAGSHTNTRTLLGPCTRLLLGVMLLCYARLMNQIMSRRRISDTKFSSWILTRTCVRRRNGPHKIR